MESHLKHGNWSKEKGLTLVETVIALTIIIIVSVAVVSIAIYSSNILIETRIKNIFVREATNIANLYLTYDDTGDNSDYKKAFNYKTGTSINLEGSTTVLYYDSNYTYVTSSDPYSYYTNVTYTDASTITISSYHQNGNSIYSWSVSK